MPALTLETPVSQVVQEVSASNNGGSSVLMYVLVIGAILFATGIGAVKWLYPNTIEDVEREIKSAGELIQENMAIGQNILGDSVWRFRDRLIQQNEEARRIRNKMNAEPDRKDFVEWIVFRWRQMRDVKANYLSLMNLKGELMTAIDERKRDLHTRHAPILTMAVDDGFRAD
ncbi:hypothetical protein E1B28_010848 [Marasmius oreades]|uniref:Uncharacterized protein n=1 Tax=Marasmius oreades TaxID=181124 RepID=A0A9P7RTL3_9AGAR|nr:uncharacterized protein E1B28_010848 [Marasmius oreades]KAG7089140.1 hypothetical protein E1B28_010848 [Marasmius oreades]